MPARASWGRDSLRRDPIARCPTPPAAHLDTGSPRPCQRLAPRVLPSIKLGLRAGRLLHHGQRLRQHARRPSAHPTCIRLGSSIVASNACAAHRTVRVPASHLAGLAGGGAGCLSFIPLPRTPTKPTLSYHILSVRRPHARRLYHCSPHLAAGLCCTCQCRGLDPQLLGEVKG